MYRINLNGIINFINRGGVVRFMNFMGQGNQMWVMIFAYVVIFGGLYFILFRPQQKKRKQEELMRKELQIGDEITTIGGIIGKVVSIKETSEVLIIETGVERNKIKIKNWAVASRDNVRPDEMAETSK